MPPAMHLLPSLQAGSVAWRLPLSDHSALHLTGAVLVDDPEQRARRLEGVLQDDPALALWAVICAERLDGRSPATVEAIANWFSHRALIILDWSHEDSSPAVGDRGKETTFYEELIACSVSAAGRAAELAEDNRAEEAYLGGLLHLTHEWLAFDGPAIEESKAGNPVPQWLRGLLAETAAPHDPHSPASFVRMALDDLLNEANANSTESVAEHCRRGYEVGRRLAVRIDGAVENLMQLTARMRRLDRLENSFDETVEREKLAAMKQLAYGASHEINNPLANISTRAQALLRDEADAERRRKLATINSQAFRAHEMIANMMLFAHPPEISAEEFDLTELVDEVIAELAAGAESQATDLHLKATERPLRIVADRTQIAVALKALGQNALEAVTGGGRVEITARRIGPARLNEADRVELTVRDNGPGIPSEVRRHLFDPFYSGREAGRGLGFGLSKCWRIVTEHGGRIEVESDGGAAFRIILPSVAPACGDQELRAA